MGDMPKASVAAAPSFAEQFEQYRVELTAYCYRMLASVDEGVGQILAKLEAVPGVESAAISAAVPLDIHGMPLRSFTIEGRATTTEAPDAALMNLLTARNCA